MVFVVRKTAPTSKLKCSLGLTASSAVDDELSFHVSLSLLPCLSNPATGEQAGFSLFCSSIGRLRYVRFVRSHGESTKRPGWIRSHVASSLGTGEAEISCRDFVSHRWMIQHILQCPWVSRERLEIPPRVFVTS